MICSSRQTMRSVGGEVVARENKPLSDAALKTTLAEFLFFTTSFLLSTLRRGRQ
jgi:hypothetical protein